MHNASLLLNITSPLRCILCSKEGTALCGVCANASETKRSLSVCYRCNGAVSDFAVCSACRSKTRLHQVWPVFEYDDRIKKVMQSFKYNRNRWLAVPLARALADQLPYLPADVVITNVPAATHRKRRRGYDQSELLARELSRHLNRSYRALLARKGKTSQVGATRRVRIEQAKHSYRSRSPSMQQQAVLIVDDVLTTGATLESCAQVLYEAGVKRVYGAVAARDL